MSDNAEFELIDTEGNLEASAYGPRKDAIREILHYAMMYGQDGTELKIYEITRTECNRNKLIEELT